MMGKRQTTKIAIGVSLLHTAKYSNASSVGKIFSLFPETPITWCIPSYPLLDTDKSAYSNIIGEIKERIKQVGDTVLPAGYSGAAHFLLTEKEVKRELSWGIKNPWKSGTEDVFNQNHPFFVTTETDFSRPEIIKLYSQKGIKGIVVPAPQMAPYVFRAVSPVSVPVIQAFSLANLSREKPEKELKYYFPKYCNEIFVIMSPESELQRALLPVFCRLIEKYLSPVYTVLPELFETHVPEQNRNKKAKKFVSDPSAGFFCNDPVSRYRLQKAADSRSKDRNDNAAVRNTLIYAATENLLPANDHPGQFSNFPFFPSKLYTANMPGEILLPGHTFDVTLKEGKLLNLVRKEKNYLPGIPSSSFIAYSSKKSEYSHSRMFSFETEDIRGLETQLSMNSWNDQPLTSISYYFYKDCPWLLISCDARYPEALFNDMVKEIVPMEIPLFELSEHETGTINALYADGTSTELSFSSDTSDTTLFGSVFYFEAGGKFIVFGTVPHNNTPVSPIPCATKPFRKRSVVSINPFGTYQHNDAFPYSGYSEFLSIYIGIRDEAPSEIPFFPRALLSGLPAASAMKLT